MLRQAAQAGAIDLAAVGLNAAEAAALFLQSVAGLKSPGVPVDEYRRQLAAFVRVFVAGLGGAGAPARRTPRRRATA